MTTADVAFTLRTMMDPHNQIASREGWDKIARIEAGRTAAGGTCAPATCFTVAFRGDYAPWRDVFSVSAGYFVLPQHVLKGKDFNTVWNTGGIVGSGPFTLESYEPRRAGGAGALPGLLGLEGRRAAARSSTGS